MARTSLLLLLLFISTTIFSQKQGNIWYFGEGVGLDFNSGTPVPISGGQVFGNPQNDNEFVFNEGCATIADSTGTLLFYTNGELIWNKNHEVMPNGDNLMGMYSSTHAAFIVPQPDSDSLFYIFTTDGLERNLEGGLRYNRVNICLEEGLGDVMINQKNLLLLPLVSEKLTAITHENGEDIWLIAHEFNSDAFYAYLITSIGIESPVISNVGSIHQGLGFYSAIGQMKASQDGNKLALVFSNVLPSVTEVFDFDKLTGTLFNPLSLTTSSNEYGVEFSPDNTKLYVSSLGGLHQFDLSDGAGTEEEVDATRILIPQPFYCIPSGLQLGPDGKIYVNRCSSFIGVINNPNNSGVACNFEDEVLSFGENSASVTFPSFMPFAEYKNEISTCEIVIGINELNSNQIFNITPNPASNIVNIKFKNEDNSKHKLSIIDMRGKIIFEKLNIQSDHYYYPTHHMQSGLYFVILESQNATYDIQKLIIQ